jgi:hypothetical protein
MHLSFKHKTIILRQTAYSATILYIYLFLFIRTYA